jgi:coenzyme F420 biosynthesis associated uncharacterized protein
MLSEGINQLMISGQMGLILGYLSQRVLGQYDLAMFGREPLTDNGKLYFVESNIAQLRERLDLDPREVEMYIVLHETTHAYEFEANPWLQAYMNSLMKRYFQTISRDFHRLSGDSNGFRWILDRIGGNIFQRGNMLEMMMNAEQKHIFAQLQALMCLLEGYSNHMMQAVGCKILPTYDAIKERFEKRSTKKKSYAERLFTKFTGLDVKMEQYALGEKFVNEIVDRRGIDFMNLIWQSPLNLPTMEEIRDPNRWVVRMEMIATAGVCA